MSGARQHAVLGRDPPLTLAAQEWRHALLDAGRTQHLRVAKGDQHRAFCVLGVAAGEAHLPQLIRRAP
jgi:hypothetical protein